MRGIADVSDELDIERSTTHRYMLTLVTLGYLEQDPSHKYRLASHAADIGIVALESHPVCRRSRALLEETARRDRVYRESWRADGRRAVLLGSRPRLRTRAA